MEEKQSRRSTAPSTTLNINTRLTDNKAYLSLYSIMGLLKHAILPLFAAVDFFLVYRALVAEDVSDLLELWKRDTNAYPITDWEIHLLHAFGGAMLVLGVNAVAAIFVENAHYRGMALFLNTLFFSVDLYSYLKMGVSNPELYVVLTIGAVSLAIHSMEPGIFTKDKNATNTSKTK